MKKFRLYFVDESCQICNLQPSCMSWFSSYGLVNVKVFARDWNNRKDKQTDRPKSRWSQILDSGCIKKITLSWMSLAKLGKAQTTHTMIHIIHSSLPPAIITTSRFCVCGAEQDAKPWHSEDARLLTSGSLGPPYCPCERNRDQHIWWWQLCGTPPHWKLTRKQHIRMARLSKGLTLL